MDLTRADSQSLHASLGRMGLLEPGEQPRLEPLTGGVSSLIVPAHTRRGPVCITPRGRAVPGSNGREAAG